MTPEQLVDHVKRVVGPPIWDWPDDLPDGQFIEWALRQLDWSNEDLARYCGVTRRAVGQWLHGHRKPKAWLRQLLKHVIITKLLLEMYRDYQPPARLREV